MAKFFTTIDHVKSIRWMNLRGENRNGFNRNRRKSFAAFLYPEDADRLAADGWRIKEFVNKYDEEAPGEPFIEIVVNFKVSPKTGKLFPEIYRCIDKNCMLMDEKMAEELDDDFIKDAHLLINPYWSADKNKATDFPTAYLHLGYFDIDVEPETNNTFEDPFAKMYG